MVSGARSQIGSGTKQDVGDERGEMQNNSVLGDLLGRVVIGYV
jgi:hypothetical protein